MKVLLLGEYSSLHKYLKEGLIKNGHHVRLYSNGDGWKKIGARDGRLYDTASSRRMIKSILKNYRDYKGYDVVQLISPMTFPSVLSPAVVSYLKKHNGILSLAAAGGDYALLKSYLNGKFDYYVYDAYHNTQNFYNDKTIKGRVHIWCDTSVVKKADIIIPGLYEYALGYKGSSRLYNCIPYPVNMDHIIYKENCVSSKVVFFHGINNEKIAGTKIIRAALEKLKEKYPSDVEMIIDGHLPFEKYLELLGRANVVADQCMRYGYGINACISLAMGKIVLSGARKETLNAFGLQSSPLICAQPDERKLFRQFEKILSEKDKIPQMGAESYRYAREVHDYRKVAEKYEQAWLSVLNKGNRV